MTTNNKLLFLGTGGVSDAVRLVLPSQELSKQFGTQITLRRLSESDQRVNLKNVMGVLDNDEFSVALFSRPSSPEIIKTLKGKGVYVVMDLDDDFHAIGTHHPAYRFMGPGNPRFLRALEECVLAADCLTVTTIELKERWKPFNSEIHIIPNGWSKEPPYWGTTYPRDTVNIGWGGTITHRKDFDLTMLSIRTIIKSMKNVKIIIAGDPHIYKLFKNTPEQQKVYVPMVQYTDWPHTLTYFDILLAPLVNDPFNAAKSDIKLIDAGAASIPWVASPVPEYVSWKDGGVLASSPHEWQEALQTLVDSEELRIKLGQEGHQKAQMREMAFLVESMWSKVLL